jgi:Ser/Thr protein kinase RdoA (MazF antagonist)
MDRVYPHMLAWREDPSDPDRPLLSNPDVRRLADEISPNSELADLGGMFSLNVGLQPAGLVLRVHQPFVTRRRLTALQEVRRRLAERGLIVPVPLPWRGSTMFRCAGRWAELEEYIPHEKPEPTLDSYLWMYGAMGTLHRALDTTGLSVPRPFWATYGPPGTLQRWLPVTEEAVRDDPEAAEIARWLRELVRRLRRQWVPATELPVRLVHGDVRLGNVARGPDGGTVYLDFGFMAHRPRIHELAYSLAWILLRPDNSGTGEDFDWQSLPRLIAEYEAAAGARLTQVERKALAPYTAAVPLYQAAGCGFLADPASALKDGTRRPFMRIGEWLLEHPEAVPG